MRYCNNDLYEKGSVKVTLDDGTVKVPKYVVCNFNF
jgi:hypothetical protein